MGAATRDKRLGTAAPIRVLIADDHAVLRAGLRMLLDAEPDIEVVGEAADGSEVLPRIREVAPDIVLLDITMPRVGGLDALRHIGELPRPPRVLILTMHDDEAHVREALAAGASGYVLKQAADTELLSAIRAVHSGGTYLHPSHARLLLDSMAERGKSRQPEAAEPQLSPREQEVLRLIALGYTNQQAADTLCLSVKTVETYRARLMVKLGFQTRADIVRYAMERGLLEP